MFDIQMRVRLGGADGDALPFIVVTPALKTIVDLMTGFAGPAIWDSAEVHGFSNPLVITERTTEDELVESTFPGYAAGAVPNWDTAGVDQDGNVIAVVDFDPFVVTGDPAGESLAGIYLVSTEALFLGACSLPDPIRLVQGLIIPSTFAVQLGNRQG